MERKVIKQGNDTLTITLPKAWTKKYSIKPGDLLDMTIMNHILEITGKKIIRNNNVSIMLDSVEYDYIRWTLGALFRSGANEINVNFRNKNILEVVQKIISNKITGFIITEQKENMCVIKCITTDDEKDLYSLINRVFITLLSFADNCAAVLQSRKLSGFNDLLYLHENTDKTIALCERIISKNSLSDINANFRIAILENLELIGDVYYDIYNLFLKVKKFYKKNPAMVRQLEEANKFLRMASIQFFSYKSDDMQIIIHDFMRCRKTIKQVTKNISGEEMLFFYHLSILCDLIKNVFPTIILLNIERK